MKKEQKKGQWKQLLALIPFLLIGAVQRPVIFPSSPRKALRRVSLKNI